MDVSLATELTSELEELWERAHRDVLAKRGGPALLRTLCGEAVEESLLAVVVARRALWTVTHDGLLVGFVVCRDQVVEALYVAHTSRRQKVATTLVHALLDSATPPIDAYALPGDRAMKSLYESLGWKARLLTMRGA